MKTQCISFLLSFLIIHCAYADDSMVLDLHHMHNSAAMPGFSISSATRAKVKKYVTTAGTIGAIIYAYKRGRGALHKDIKKMQETLARLEKEQQKQGRDIHSVQRTQKDHTDYLHNIRTEVRSLRGHQEKRFNTVDQKLGELNQKMDAHHQHNALEMGKQQGTLDEILGVVKEHQNESRHGMVGLARGIYAIIKDKASSAVERM